MPEDTPAAPSAPALGFSITSNITDRSQIVVQSFVPLDASDEQINDTLDKVMKACDRQRAKYQLKDFKLKMEMEEAALADQISKVADLQNSYVNEHATSGRRGEFKPSANQTAAINNARKTIEGMKFNVERYRANLAELEALAK
jgi:hypothetical protein